MKSAHDSQKENDMNTSPVVMFDLDGTLCDDRWRQHLILSDNVTHGDLDAKWDAYHAACGQDLPINLHLLDGLSTFDVAFVTSRPEKFREKTKQWLRENIYSHRNSPLLMRPIGDHRHSPELKVDLMRKHLGGGDNVTDAYDDRQDVLEALFMAGVKRTHLMVPPPLAGSATKTPADILQGMIETYHERTSVYGGNYYKVAKLVAILWPDGVPPDLVIKDQWHLFELKLIKLTRFAGSNLTHIDSIHDDAVYSAIIESVLLEQGQGT